MSDPTSTATVPASRLNDATADWSKVLAEESEKIPPGIVSERTVAVAGILLFVLAQIWPPLILVATYLAATMVPYLFRINDDATTRRQMLHIFEKEDRESDCLREIPDDVQRETGFWLNERNGALLHYNIFTPKNQPIQAVVCNCHGYTDNPSYTKGGFFARVAQQGIAVVMVDYEGHGKSDGHLALIRDFDVFYRDVHAFFESKVTERFPGLPRFLWGESLGGAVAFKIITNFKDYAGAIFMAPMCKIADNMMPAPWVVDLFRMVVGPSGTVSALGYLPVAPSKGDIRQLTFKLAHKRALFGRAPSVFGRKPRLATARELLRATQDISGNLSALEAPFLILHGKDDRVTDPKLSQALYDEAKSEDKTIQLYDGMWHGMSSGEPQENVDLILKDTTAWILARSSGSKKEN
eukprot:Nitzschia sp. Nitz4//scaffold364_size14896//10634//11938//NITZ4_008911-RA/size14896-augustus-gene-0.2-mRNA-1//-1//CDS//3329549279//4279//frame0